MEVVLNAVNSIRVTQTHTYSGKICRSEREINYIKSKEKMDVNLEDQKCTDYVPGEEWM